ncbi:MoxR family ATPase [Paenibacillus chondroitinus]|uniref:MoxR family ATPase n=1 Tax=Paenibacillus chondroitinus TaxID=59842 RepID=A0ABU6DMW2_9BACL|nr:MULTISPECIES: MoxR family ATPase [Paenibacillus]MCY9657417.1 MoxR family ATPase [Paenibacillus anseongense]MEB4799124.1 MoxR family ATPase [Paenibacillus chondroitinus]
MLTEAIPQEIREQLEQKRGQTNATAEDAKLIGAAAFEAPREDILIDSVIALFLGKNVLLKGPTGSGKTKLAEHVSAIFNQPMHAVNCSTDLDAEALLGFKTLSHDEQGRSQIVFIPGPIMKAMTKGHFLYIDEINMAKPETLSLINGVLDYRRSITNPFTGEVITAHPDFRVVAAINEGYMGTVPLNEALKNRFVTVDIPYLQGEALYKLLKSKSVLRDDKQLRTYVQLSADLLTLIEMGQLPDEAGSIRALLDACDLTAYIPPMRAVARAIADKLEDERERAAVINAAETLF